MSHLPDYFCEPIIIPLVLKIDVTDMPTMLRCQEFLQRLTSKDAIEKWEATREFIAAFTMETPACPSYSTCDEDASEAVDNLRDVGALELRDSVDENP